MDLNGKVAVVTGGSSGIGQAISIALAKAGCQVIFTYNSSETGAAKTLQTLGKNGAKFKLDLHRPDQIQALFDFVSKQYGHLDILVNSAGINRPRDLWSLDTWREVFEINLFALVHCTELAVKLMQGHGKILNISSIYAEGKACWQGMPAYGASKAAVSNFTQVMAKNLGSGILVNAIAPGYVQTPLWQDTSEKQFVESGHEQLIDRMIQPDEIAHMAMAILQNDAITGEIVVVDGGISLKTI